MLGVVQDHAPPSKTGVCNSSLLCPLTIYKREDIPRTRDSKAGFSATAVAARR